jgi:hypothetical protein
VETEERDAEALRGGGGGEAGPFLHSNSFVRGRRGKTSKWDESRSTHTKGSFFERILLCVF